MSYSWFITSWWGGRKRMGRRRMRGERCAAASWREGSLENKRHINLCFSVSILRTYKENAACASCKFCSWSSWWSLVGQVEDVISFIQHDLCVQHDLCWFTQTHMMHKAYLRVFVVVNAVRWSFAYDIYICFHYPISFLSFKNVIVYFEVKPLETLLHEWDCKAWTGFGPWGGLRGSTAGVRGFSRTIAT